jgi:hypothetical protein
LVWVLGFPLEPSDSFPWGFVDASLSCPHHFGRVLPTLPDSALQFLLCSTRRLLGDALPPGMILGEDISLDTKHVIAKVKENDPRAYLKDRYDKTRRPKGDPDCRLGCKRRHNRVPESSTPTETPPPTPTTDHVPAASVEVGEFYWGYTSGVIATKVPNRGEFVLAEFT